MKDEKQQVATKDVAYKYTKEDIIEMICKYNGTFVLFDFCLCKLFDYTIGNINQSLKRNQDIKEFFTLIYDEIKDVENPSVIFDGNSVIFEGSTVNFTLKIGKKYSPKLFTKESIKLLGEKLKKENVHYYLPIILEAFNEIEIDTRIIDKIEENINNSNISNRIHTIRGMQVMLSYDLAPLYGYTVSAFNQYVERNKKRFTDAYRFLLTKEEWNQILKSQNVISSWGGNRNIPYAFTEKGILALSSVLKSDKAIEQGHYIIEQFILMRQVIKNNTCFIQHEPSNITSVLVEHESRLNSLANEFCASKKEITDTLSSIQEELNKNKIQGEFLENILDSFNEKECKKEMAFFKNQFFEADVAFKDIFSQAHFSIYLIDNYISIKTLSHLKSKKEEVSVIIFSNNLGYRDKLRKPEFDDFNSEYSTIELKPNNESHDRYIILDYNTEYEKIYHSGASIKDAGKKLCNIVEINDTNLYHDTIERLLTQDSYEPE